MLISNARQGAQLQTSPQLSSGPQRPWTPDLIARADSRSRHGVRADGKDTLVDNINANTSLSRNLLSVIDASAREIV